MVSQYPTSSTPPIEEEDSIVYIAKNIVACGIHHPFTSTVRYITPCPHTAAPSVESIATSSTSDRSNHPQYTCIIPVVLACIVYDVGQQVLSSHVIACVLYYEWILLVHP